MSCTGHGGHGGHEAHGGHDGGHSRGHDLEKPLLDDHGHEDHGSAASIRQEEQAKLKKAVYLALFVMFVEIAGGILANSLAIITDAAHMLSDVGGFIVSLVCLQLAAQGATAEYTYGFKQAEVLGALLSIAIVWALTAVLLWEAVQRLYDPEEINAPYMFGISVLGFLVNLVLMKVLGHSHGGKTCSGGGGDHGHAHGDKARSQSDISQVDNSEEASLAMKAAMAHVIGDIVQSLGVCLAALCIWVQPFDVGFTDKGVSKWNYADPACTVLFGFLVLNTTKSTLQATINSLMIKAPENIDQKKLAEALSRCPNVKSIHDLHVWSLGSNDVLCTAHFLVEGKGNTTAALIGAIKVAKKMGIAHSTFQMEVVGEFDPDQCGGCDDHGGGGGGGEGHAAHGGGHAAHGGGHAEHGGGDGHGHGH